MPSAIARRSADSLVTRLRAVFGSPNASGSDGWEWRLEGGGCIEIGLAPMTDVLTGDPAGDDGRRAILSAEWNWPTSPNVAVAVGCTT